jgi:outer membrane lipoprotein
VFDFRAILLMFSLALVGCSSLPTDLASDDEELISDYSTWTALAPVEPISLRLGGVIADIQNLSDKTRIELVNLPIDDSGKPNINKQPRGRFIVYLPGFVDPVTYAEGRLVTVLGKSAGEEDALVGKYEYTFPVLEADALHLWTVKERVVMMEQGSSLFPCRGLYCRDPAPSLSTGRIIQVVE